MSVRASTARRTAMARWGCRQGSRGKLQDEAVQVLVCGEAGRSVADVGSVNRNGCLRQLRRPKGDLFERLLDDRMEASGADVLHPLVNLPGNPGHLADTVRSELQLD